MILIQVGSNDLDSTKGFELVHDIECDLLRLRVLLPDVKIVWSELLQRALSFCKIPDHIRSHSFRIGVAMEASLMVISDEVVKKWGRWSILTSGNRTRRRNRSHSMS
jgi:hypothetical protein